MKPIEILRETRALLADPAHWTKNTQARFANGFSTRYDNPEAVQFCLWGAICRQARDPRQNFTSPDPNAAKAERSVIYAITRVSNTHRDIPSFNDGPATRHADVLEVLDLAIADLAKEDETA